MSLCQVWKTENYDEMPNQIIQLWKLFDVLACQPSNSLDHITLALCDKSCYEQSTIKIVEMFFIHFFIAFDFKMTESLKQITGGQKQQYFIFKLDIFHDNNKSIHCSIKYCMKAKTIPEYS